MVKRVSSKTGSSEDNSTETFVGFTPQICAAGTAADAANPNDHVGSAVEAQVVTAVAKTLAAAMEGAPTLNFPQPPDALAFGG